MDTDKIKSLIKEHFPICNHYQAQIDYDASVENLARDISSQLEPLVRQGVSQPVFACGNCEHCKLDDDKTSASQGKYYCERHGDNIFEMFTETAFGENLTLESVGCRQFKKKRASKSA